MSEAPQKNKSQTILIGLLVVAAFAIGMMWQRIQNLQESPPAAKPGTEVAGDTGGNTGNPEDIKPVDASDYVRGNPNAPITWIEYSDLECPFCKRIHPDLVKLMDEYDGKVRWVYRHFPLEQLHPKAPKEAEAAECVGELAGSDAFWAFIDKIYEVTPANNGLDLDKLPDYAAEAGANRTQFETCLESGQMAQNVQDDYQSGLDAGVSGTPGNVVMNENGDVKVVPGALPYDQLKATVEELL